MNYDVVVVGGGVTGCAIARALSAYRLKIALLEAADDVAMGSSKANSAIVHSGYDAEPGTLMAELNVKGNAMMEQLCKQLNVPFKRTGSMTVAFDDEQQAHLERLLEQGRKNGVPGLEIHTGEWARQREPNLSPQVQAVLWAPSAGINCPYQLTVALAENAVANGVELKRNWRLTAVQEQQEALALTNQAGETITARYVVNAAGLYADEVSRMAGGEAFTIVPRRGEYMLLDRKEGKRVSTVIFQVPTKMGKGVLVSPTVDGNVFAGPTSQDITDKTDTSTTAEGMAALRRTAALSVPSLGFGQVITSFTGLRAQWQEKHDFLIGISQCQQRLIQAAGICSPGLTSAPAVAQLVVSLLGEAGLPLAPNETFSPLRPRKKPFREMNDGERAQAVKENPLYGRIICRCETVTEAEIVAAIHSPVPATSVDAVKRRTRAGMGRCQGGFCSPRVMEILARELGCDMGEITKFGGGSWLTCGRIKEQGGEGRE